MNKKQYQKKSEEIINKRVKLIQREMQRFVNDLFELNNKYFGEKK